MAEEAQQASQHLSSVFEQARHANAVTTGHVWTGTIEAQTALSDAICASMEEWGEIRKTKTGRVGTGPFKYAAISDIQRAVQRPLAKQKVFLSTPSFTLGDGRYVGGAVLRGYGASIECYLSAKLDDLVSGGRGSRAQLLGMLLTYLRRYALQGVLGIEGDADVDDGEVDEPANSKSPAPRRTDTPKRAPAETKGPSPETSAQLRAEAERLGLGGVRLGRVVALYCNGKGPMQLTEGDGQVLLQALRDLPDAAAAAEVIRGAA